MPVIYLQDEIAFEGVITNLAFDKASGTDTSPHENVSVYMKHTSNTALSSGKVSLDGYKKLYNGNS